MWKTWFDPAHSSRHARDLAWTMLLFAPACLSPSVVYASPESLIEQIADASLEDLLKMEVTTVANAPEELRRAPAAVYVLTGDEIRRSGATSIPEALRLVPGVNVARREANKWAVSIRGFNGRAADKLLVMIDGRTIYDPLFSGTLWEMRDVFLEDVERIEVVRGPGGSTWGANAVNGVINIITKHAKDTQGTYLSAGGGSEERILASARHGERVGDDAFYRVYNRYYSRDDGALPTGRSDDSFNGQGGFRFDSRVDDRTTYTVDGNAFSGEHDGTRELDDVYASGAALRTAWSRALDGGGTLDAQAFYEFFDLDASIIGEKRNTAELDLQHRNALWSGSQLISAFQYRFSADRITGNEIATVQPHAREDNLVSASLQLRQELVQDVLEGRIGGKIEHNDYSDIELQPDAALTWTIDDSNTLWASVSRAVRTPSRLENDFLITDPATGSIQFTGNRQLRSENLVSYQAGYRVVPMRAVLVDVAAFYHDYDDLVIVEGATIDNAAEGETYGAELALTLSPADHLTIRGAYSYLHMELERTHPELEDLGQIALLEGNSPENQFSISVGYTILPDWELDTTVRYVDRLSSPHVSSYTVADVRVAYHVTEALQLAVVGQNLFDAQHFEQGGPESSEVESGVYGVATLRF